MPHYSQDVSGMAVDELYSSIIRLVPKSAEVPADAALSTLMNPRFPDGSCKAAIAYLDKLAMGDTILEPFVIGFIAATRPNMASSLARFELDEHDIAPGK